MLCDTKAAATIMIAVVESKCTLWCSVLSDLGQDPQSGGLLTSLNAPFGAHLAGLLENVACNSANSPSRFEVRTLKFCGFLVLVDTCSRELHARFWVLGAFWPGYIKRTAKLNVMKS